LIDLPSKLEKLIFFFKKDDSKSGAKKIEKFEGWLVKCQQAKKDEK
jgi:hypothetical protein